MSRTWTSEPCYGVPDGTILFDGVCVLCSWWVRFLIERDTSARFRFVPIQSPYGRKLAARWRIDLERPQTNAVVANERVYFKSDAAIQALVGLPGRSWALWLTRLPRPLRNWIYDRVARNRYETFGKTETCMVPSPELARRFVFDVPEELR